jgi:hypothetical protein
LPTAYSQLFHFSFFLFLVLAFELVGKPHLKAINRKVKLLSEKELISVKTVMNEIMPLFHQMHPYPFWMLIGFLYTAILLFGLCGGVMWIPRLIPEPHVRESIGELLFQSANCLLAIGGILSPLLDLIIHHDFKK